MEHEKFAKNEKALNDSIFYYILQVKRLLGGEWLFYQADSLDVMQRILAHHDWCRQNREHAKLIESICRSFIGLLRKNQLALVESLFHYPSQSLKDEIMRNYSHYEEERQPAQ